MSSASVSLDDLGAAGVIAVVRAASADAAVTACEALLRGGVRALELTFTTPGVLDAISALRERDDALIGAGTITMPGQAAAAVEAGARYLVSPGFDELIVAEMVATGAVTLAGVFTAGEAMRARRLGTSAIKLFPAGIGGVALLRALREPFPDLPIIPTGGVTPENLHEWLAGRRPRGRRRRLAVPDRRGPRGDRGPRRRVHRGPPAGANLNTT